MNTSKYTVFFFFFLTLLSRFFLPTEPILNICYGNFALWLHKLWRIEVTLLQNPIKDVFGYSWKKSREAHLVYFGPELIRMPE